MSNDQQLLHTLPTWNTRNAKNNNIFFMYFWYNSLIAKMQKMTGVGWNL